jgi:hypothetical protein
MSVQKATSEQAARRNETEAERLDRNLLYLMQELRVAFPGVQILLAFLLVVPFQNGWPDVTDSEKVVYSVALLLTAASSICFIAPTAWHRIRFRDQDIEWVIRGSNRLMIAGLIFLGAAIASALMLIAMVVYGVAAGITVAAVAATVIVGVWFVVPALRSGRKR